MFISFFFKQRKAKKVVRVETEDIEHEVVVEAGDDDDDNEAVMEEADLDAQAARDDVGQIAHDESVVKSMRQQAIREMARKNVKMTSSEEKDALRLFPMVSYNIF